MAYHPLNGVISGDFGIRYVSNKFWITYPLSLYPFQRLIVRPDMCSNKQFARIRPLYKYSAVPYIIWQNAHLAGMVLLLRGDHNEIP